MKYLRGRLCAILYLRLLSEARTWPTGFLEDTCALIILAVSSPQHVAAVSAQPECAELFTPAAFQHHRSFEHRLTPVL